MRGISTTALIAALLLAGTVARAEDVAGKQTYLRYCGACHGPDGRGDGIAGTFMRPKPTDLTQIAKKNGGEFPVTRVMADIDGRNTVRAHGDPQMPVWGEIFREEAGSPQGPQNEARSKVVAITEYVRSIQQK
ncbi:MAG TPA: cytochrome c [Candidatus Eisenbacteria bacterium]|nr:cytochrome c [Candidatus Eisenbacteria bacterium]